MKSLFLILAAGSLTSGQIQSKDEEYSASNACYGAGTVMDDGLCANFTGATYSICWGFKNALRNTCDSIDAGDAKLACLGFRESHKKGNCNKIPGVGKDVCLAYTSSQRDSEVCSYGSTRMKAICYGFVYAWSKQLCEHDNSSTQHDKSGAPFRKD